MLFEGIKSLNYLLKDRCSKRSRQDLSMTGCSIHFQQPTKSLIVS